MVTAPPVPPQAFTAARREQLGHIVHETYVTWLAEQPKPWTVELPAWQDRHPAAQEMCRRIGEAVAAAEWEACAQLAERRAAEVSDVGLAEAFRRFAALLREQPPPQEDPHAAT